MLIWIRAKRDELVYTAFVILGLGSFFLLVITGNLTLFVGLFLLAWFIFLMGIIWNS